jgi:hypothetical protein
MHSVAAAQGEQATESGRAHGEQRYKYGHALIISGVCLTASMSLRTSIESASRPLLVFLARLPRFVVPIAMVAVTVGGLMAQPPRSGVLVALLAAFVSWLVFLSWPALSRGNRIVRTVILAMLLAYAVTQL